MSRIAAGSVGGASRVTMPILWGCVRDFTFIHPIPTRLQYSAGCVINPLPIQVNLRSAAIYFYWVPCPYKVPMGCKFLGGTMLFSSRKKQLLPVECCCGEHLYQMTVWPCDRLPRIRYRSRRVDMSGPDLGLRTKKRRLHGAQKSHLEGRSGFRLCQR